MTELEKDKRERFEVVVLNAVEVPWDPRGAGQRWRPGSEGPETKLGAMGWLGSPVSLAATNWHGRSVSRPKR